MSGIGGFEVKVGTRLAGAGIAAAMGAYLEVQVTTIGCAQSTGARDQLSSGDSIAGLDEHAPHVTEDVVDRARADPKRQGAVRRPRGPWRGALGRIAVGSGAELFGPPPEQQVEGRKQYQHQDTHCHARSAPAGMADKDLD